MHRIRSTVRWRKEGAREGGRKGVLYRVTSIVGKEVGGLDSCSGGHFHDFRKIVQSRIKIQASFLKA